MGDEMLIERELIIEHRKPDSLDIQPRGAGCPFPPANDHEFFLSVQAAGFTYEICGRCGTVRITERHQ